jgi:hypothetical protein
MEIIEGAKIQLKKTITRASSLGAIKKRASFWDALFELSN